MNLSELIKKAPSKVVPYFHTKTYAKGSSILMPEEKNSSLYLLVEGSAEVYQYTLNGMFLSLYHYEADSCFGEVELYCEDRTTLGISALEDCKIVRISKRGVELWVHSDSQFCDFLLSQMARKIAENSDVYIRSLSMGLKERVLHCIYRHARMGNLSTLTKEQIVNEVCIPIRSLNRILAQCREEGLVIYEKHRFVIVDEESAAFHHGISSV